MSHLVSLDLIKHRLAQQVDSLVPRLFPNARMDGPHWRLGSIAGEPGQSLAVNRHGKFQGCWRDFAAGTHGTMLDLVAEALCGGDISAAIPRARELAGLGQIDPEEAKRREREAAIQRARAERAAAERAEKIGASTHRIFMYEAEPLPGSPSERYLMGRGIRLAEIGGAPRALRHHPGLRHPATGQLHPCMVALVMGLDGEPRGIHRTFLEQHADGRVTKLLCVGKDAKLSLGPISGGHIPLWRGRSGKPSGHMPAGEWIVLTEGIEDALSVAYECPDLRIWAGVSLSNMGGMELPDACGGVWWHRHRDGEAATASALRQQERLRTRSGRPVSDIWAPAPYKDFNEARQAADLIRFARMGEPGREGAA